MKQASKFLKLSSSSIKLYEQCPRKYYYQYIDKPDIPKKPQDHLELGNFVHKVLERFHPLAGTKESKFWPEIMTELFNEELLNYNLTIDTKSSAFRMLITYLNSLKENGMPNVASNEQDFSITFEEDHFLVRGYIDRIDHDERGYHIVDYKSGASKYLDEFQLLVYGLYLINTYPDIETYKASYLMLKEGSKYISYTFTRTDLERCLKKIKGIAEDIRTNQTWEPKPSQLCSYCDFEEMCPATLERQQDTWSIKTKAKKYR